MRFISRNLGEIEYSEEAIITFDEGIPGFEDTRKYVLILSEDGDFPFHYLQCVDNPDVAFVVTSPFLFVEDYDFNLSDSVVHKLSIKNPEELYVYGVVTVPKKVEFSTINLTAPIIINTTSKKGMQVALDEIDDISHPLFSRREG